MTDTTVPTPPEAEAVLSFWFGTDPAQPLANAKRWFERDDDFDAEIRARFAALVERAAGGELDAWQAVPRGALAYVILLDQFPRNLHRDSPRAFTHDDRARAFTEAGLDRGLERALAPVERWFFIMPLMHAEDLPAQERCCDLLAALVAETEGPVREALANALAFGERHRDVIARFGRFPHRNAVLGRKTTPAEAVWLEAHPQGF